ncbi:hypothetical protein GOP47_0005189 [Adiantum capillus-veneris]|uniref:Uncharacterized protein n=1 Tax=Adiantum capillus-veneris TaxID=13818 RepID=A0A9D4V4M8_ADICA|nr:hypothetical protein GOP47_0005189 [Adiantum capillus-veneris]
MVDHHGERSCEVLPQKVDTFSTPKIAPATPMQAWQKPLHRQESPDAVPSLSLGRNSAELKASYVHSHSSSPSIPPKCGVVASTPSFRPCSGSEQQEKLLSFSLSKYEESLDMATPLRNHMGPSSSHRVCAPAGVSKNLPIGSTAFPQDGHISSSVGVVDESTPHACKSEPATNDAEMVCKAEDSLSPYSPVPGEVANDAYKLYSKLFPSTSIGTVVCLLSSKDIDANSVLGQVVDCKKLPTSEGCGHKPLARKGYSHNEAPPVAGKKLKLTLNEEGVPSKRILSVKEEPVFEEPCDTHKLSSYGDAYPTGGVGSTWKGHSGPCNENVLKDFTFPRSLHMQPENMSTFLNSSIPSTDFNHIGYVGDYSEDVKPTIGLKPSTLSENAQLPASLPMLGTGEPSRLLASRVGAWESPARGNPSVDTDWGKFLALSATPTGNTDAAIMLPFQQRFRNLQAFLKQCDEADQTDRLQGLRSLSTAARSGYAVELETRAIHLSLEEGKELQRMRLLNVLGRSSENNLEELGATPHGPRLPVLGATLALSNAP